MVLRAWHCPSTPASLFSALPPTRLRQDILKHGLMQLVCLHSQPGSFYRSPLVQSTSFYTYMTLEGGRVPGAVNIRRPTMPWMWSVLRLHSLRRLCVPRDRRATFARGHRTLQRLLRTPHAALLPCRSLHPAATCSPGTTSFALPLCHSPLLYHVILWALVNGWDQTGGTAWLVQTCLLLQADLLSPTELALDGITGEGG